MSASSSSPPEEDGPSAATSALCTPEDVRRRIVQQVNELLERSYQNSFETVPIPGRTSLVKMQTWMPFLSPKKMVRNCHKILRKDPTHYRTLCRLSTAYKHLGENDEALHVAEVVVQVKPCSWEGYRLRGRAHHALGNRREALLDIKEAVSLSRCIGHQKLIAQIDEALAKLPDNPTAPTQRDE
jgi:hypothetical protein